MIHLLIAVVAAFVAASLLDWIFMGLLFHERYKRYPEIWREGESETRKIALAQIASAMTAVAFVCLARLVGPLSLESALEVAALAWLAGPLPLLFGNHLFIKLDSAVTATHAIGWLMKFLVVAAIAVTL